MLYPLSYGGFAQVRTCVRPIGFCQLLTFSFTSAFLPSADVTIATASSLAGTLAERSASVVFSLLAVLAGKIRRSALARDGTACFNDGLNRSKLSLERRCEFAHLTLELVIGNLCLPIHYWW